MKETVEKIYSYISRGEKKGLENMCILGEELGWKKPSYKIIHVAGTNGKGSVSATLEHILFKAGYRVGKFTSPHILRVNERIAYNQKEIEDRDFIELFHKVEKVIEKRELSPTFFEIMTAMMIEYFMGVELDYLILETGIGGRLDSTNILDGDYAIITNIGYDHTEMLGDTLEKIAFEKAGIVKRGAQVILCGAQSFLKEEVLKNNPAKVMDVMEEYQGVRYFLDFENFRTIIYVGEREFAFSLFGEHQVRNFLTAYHLLKIIGVEDEIIAKNISGVKLSCRFEIIEKNPCVILDGAHNSHGMKALGETMRKGYHPEEVMVITAILKDKDVKEMVEEIEKFSSKVVVTSLLENKRGTTGEVLKKYFTEDKTMVEDNLEKALEIWKNSGKKVLLICGSFYLLSKIKERIENEWENFEKKKKK